MQWSPSPMSMVSGPQFIPQAVPSPSQLQTPAAAAALWDKEFQSHQASLLPSSPAPQQPETATPRQKTFQDLEKSQRETSDLARTAALLIDAVKDEQNPKFKNSEFMRLMRGLRDGDVVVDGTDMVERSEARSESVVDVKGKGRELPFSPIPNSQATEPFPETWAKHQFRLNQAQALSQSQQNENATASREEDPNEAYFRQENQEYIDYWSGLKTEPSVKPGTAEWQKGSEWGDMQESWEKYEATTWGVKPVAHYQFQPHNPYLMGEGSQRTMNHDMHSQRSTYEVCSR